MQTLLSFIVPFAIVTAVTPLIRRFALRWKLGDKPNGRKIHTSTIPHLGGIGIVIGTIATVGVVGMLDGTGATSSLLVRFVVPVGVIVAMGLVDDMKNLRPRQKLALQIVAAAALSVSGFHLLVGIPVLDQNVVFVVLLSMFYLVGVSSALNLVDGMDGVASGLAFISAGAFAVMSLMAGAPAILFLSLALAGSCLGFLIHNFPPGRIFMGDTGSTFLGIILGILSCSFTMLQPGINMFLAVCLILAIPMMDACLAIVRRIAQRQPVFVADNQHIHHVIHSFGFTNRETLFILYTLQGVMALLGVLAMKGLMVAIVLGIVMVVLTFATFLRIMLVSPERSRPVPREFVHSSIPSLEK